MTPKNAPSSGRSANATANMVNVWSDAPTPVEPGKNVVAIMVVMEL